jgi:hypothetical protein
LSRGIFEEPLVGQRELLYSAIRVKEMCGFELSSEEQRPTKAKGESEELTFGLLF